MFVDRVIAAKSKKIKTYPCHTNRASDLGHECLRYLVLSRIAWEKATLHDITLQFIFDEGNLHEKAVLHDLAEAGIEVVEQQTTFSWKEYNITGHIDGKVYFSLATQDYPGLLGPLEIKSMNQWDWAKIDPNRDVTQFLESKKHWLRKYPAQMQLYLIMDNSERGVFIFKNKQTGQLAEVFATLDFDYCEMLLKKAIEVNRYVKAEEIPPPIKYDPKICNSCKFFQNVCMQEIDIKPTELDPEDREELTHALDSIYYGGSIAREVAEAKEAIKTLSTDRERILVESSETGLWLVGGQWIERKNGTRYWKTKYTQIKQEMKEDV